MPLRAYEPRNPPCRLCGVGFEVMQQPGAPPLSTCPTCGQPVTPRVAHRVASPRVTKPVTTSQAKDAGFSVLRRSSDGKFEKQ